MPPKKKQKVKRVVAKIKQKVKVTQNVIVNVGGKGVAKRKKPKRVAAEGKRAAEGTRFGKKESKPTYVQIPLIVPSQPFQPSSVAFSSPELVNSALKTDNTRQQVKIEQIARADATLEKAQEERERRGDLLARIRHKRFEEGVVSVRERESEASKLLSRRIDKQREDMRLAMMDD